MLNVGDKVARVGRAQPMLVVEVIFQMPGWFVCAWPVSGRPVERAFHRSAIILLAPKRFMR